MTNDIIRIIDETFDYAHLIIISRVFMFFAMAIAGAVTREHFLNKKAKPPVTMTVLNAICATVIGSALYPVLAERVSIELMISILYFLGILAYDILNCILTNRTKLAKELVHGLIKLLISSLNAIVTNVKKIDDEVTDKEGENKDESIDK